MFENCGVLVTDNGSYHRFEPEYSSKNELGNFKDGKCCFMNGIDIDGVALKIR